MYGIVGVLQVLYECLEVFDLGFKTLVLGLEGVEALGEGAGAEDRH